LTVSRLPVRAASVSNPGATRFGDEILLLVRVENAEGFSAIYVARSRNGVNDWRIGPKPLLAPGQPEHPYEKWGCEDARVVFIEEQQKWYITYVAYSPMGPAVALARTADFESVERLGLLGTTNDKDGALFCQRLGDRWGMLHRPEAGGREHIWLSYSSDLRYWGDPACVMFEGEGPSWDRLRIGAGPPPILVDDGWLLIYHGVKGYAGHLAYRAGVALLDRDQPERVLARSKTWVFQAEAQDETTGLAPNVVFPAGAIIQGDELWMYYGAADTCVCLAVAKVRELKSALE
jgi:predicted GH43/DUF377 family glycosyl hydrolase